MRGGRYTPKGGFFSLYLAPEGGTALAETNALLVDDDGMAPGPLDDVQLVFQVAGSVAQILDLTDEGVLKALDVTTHDLRAGWVRAQDRFARSRGPLPLTQQLGLAAFVFGNVIGLRYPSAQVATAKNLAVFTDRLRLSTASSLEVLDPRGVLPPQRLPESVP